MLAQPQPGPISCLKERTINRLVARWEGAMAVGVVGDGQTNLLEIVGTGRTPCLLAHGLNRRQQKGDQDRDDRDHNQKLDQGETGPP